MVKKTCRVCGSSYPVCKNASRNPNGVFRWQEVACSPQCGKEYFEQIEASRTKKQEEIIEATPDIKETYSYDYETESDDYNEFLFEDSEIIEGDDDDESDELDNELYD